MSDWKKTGKIRYREDNHFGRTWRKLQIEEVLVTENAIERRWRDAEDRDLPVEPEITIP